MLLCLPNICTDLIRGKHIPKVNSDVWQDVGALLHFRLKAVQHEMTSQGISTTRKFQDSAGKLIASVLLDSGVIHIDFLPHSVTVNALYYSNLFLNDVH
jgi:hypothetical protein